MSDQTLIALLCGGFAIVMLAIVAVALREAAAMKRWPIVSGRVVSSAVEQYHSSAGRDRSMTLYRPAIVYEYTVGADRFRGQRIAQSPGMDRAVPDVAQKVVDRYPRGSAVDVHYDPERPADSVLEARVPTGWMSVGVIAAALLSFAAYTYIK